MNKLALIVLSIGIFGCSDELTLPSPIKETQQKSLCVFTKIIKNESIALSEQFKAGSTLGLFITKKTENLYKGCCKLKNRKVEAFITKENMIKWICLPTINLEDYEPVNVYAYYPHRADAFCLATDLPIYISPIATLTSDYMYGTHTEGHKPVNRNCPYVFLSMKHALSLLLFRIRLKRETKDSYKINAIQIRNKAGNNILCNRGTLDITTGNLTHCVSSCTASTCLKLDIPEPLDYETCKTYEIMIMPTVQSTKRPGDVEVLFTINQITYIYKIPEKTHWKKGTQYLYEFCFDGTQIELEKYRTSHWTSGKR